jgi:hypothetical protein
MATCLISNLGELSTAFDLAPGQPVRFGSATTTRWQVFAPLRPHSNVFVCLFTYLGQLNLNVTYNSSIINASQVEELIDSGVRNLLEE